MGLGLPLGSAFTPASLPSLVALTIREIKGAVWRAPMNTVGSWRNLDQFPLSRLQKLTLQSTFNSPVELLEVLERCTSLRSLTFRVTQEQAEEDDESVVQPSIVLSNLTTLVVELPLHLPPGLRRTMCSLSFPRIQNLRIITSPCQNWNAPTWHAHFIHVRTLGSHHPSYGAGLAAPYEDLSLLRSSPWVLDLLRLCAFQEIEEFVISNDLSWPGVMDFLDSDQLLGAFFTIHRVYFQLSDARSVRYPSQAQIHAATLIAAISQAFSAMTGISESHLIFPSSESYRLSTPGSRPRGFKPWSMIGPSRAESHPCEWRSIASCPIRRRIPSINSSSYGWDSGGLQL